MKYQAGENLSWWFKTYILRKKGLAKPQLYRFADQKPPISVTAQIGWAWNTYVLRKKGLVKPGAYVQPAPRGEKQV